MVTPGNFRKFEAELRRLAECDSDPVANSFYIAGPSMPGSSQRNGGTIVQVHTSLHLTALKTMMLFKDPTESLSTFWPKLSERRTTGGEPGVISYNKNINVTSHAKTNLKGEN